ncbi:zinc metalloprotease HtpX [bacterium]|nr:zinc metalloprotease HtpX [bacterium]
MTVFFAVVTGLGFLMTHYTGNSSFLYSAALLSIVMNVVAYWKSDTIAISSSGAIPADPAQYAQLHALVEKMAAQEGVPKPRVYIINDPAPNAFATGRNPAHAAVAATTGLLHIMNQAELEGVIAHEMSHVVNRDILVSSVAVVLVGLVASLSNLFIHASAFGGSNNENRSPLFAILGFIGIIVAPLAANLVHLAISRKRESLADLSGAELTRDPEGLASALEKLEQYSRPMQSASAATAHLFISNPFGALPAGLSFQRLFSTHPPLEERIAVLRGLKM